MKIAVPLRQRRLLALCAASAALHLALLELVARHGGGAPSAMRPSGAELRLRLVPPLPSTQAPSARTAAGPPAPAQAAPPMTRGVASRPASNAPLRPPAPPAAALPVAAASPDTAVSPPGPTAGPALVQMPGRYHVRFPGSAVLTYTQLVQRPGTPPTSAGPARIDWHTDGRTYRLDIDGVTGRMHSEGDGGDAGIVPRRYVEQRGADTLVTEFDGNDGRVLFRAGGGEAPGAIGIQDAASLLLQLAGIGFGEPDQVADRIDVVVADSAATAIVRFQVMDDEDVETGVGRIAARRLSQVVAPGQPRLEVWLAPARDWLPVQLRVSRPDGSVVTQTLSGIEGAPAAP
ncbi:DUF3108 domain-containing protein [Massilia sp. TN1-12]|uniref:DUF3108 domain-containing protein n=1 Tax=Massilia paldalensis TaxID=3377675 RepID=UPI00384A7DB0